MKKFFLAIIAFYTISLYAQDISANEVIKPIEIGDRFRELVVPDSNNVKVKLSDYCGKGYYTLIEFGWTMCRPCHKDVSILKGIYDKYHPYGLKIISIFIDAKKEHWKSFIAKYTINWFHLLDVCGYKAKEVYGVKLVPLYLIIDPQGYVIFKNIGEQGHGSRNLIVPKLQELYGF